MFSVGDRDRLPLRSLLLCLVALGFCSEPALSQAETDPRLPACQTDYVIKARVDGETKRLDGELEVRWTNRTQDEVGELYFHLYHNAFANNRSTHIAEGGSSRRRRASMKDGEWGWQRIMSVRVGEEELSGTITYETPTEESDGTFADSAEDPAFRAEDRSVFRVELPNKVGPGETLTVQVDWQAQIPRVRRRTGYKDNFFLMAHWFPKLGVYEEGRGWNCHRFHVNTEFFANFGTYDVTLDLPAEYKGKVSASGVKQVERASGDRVEIQWVAPSIDDQAFVDQTGKRPLLHGFAWSADPDNVVVESRFVFDEWAERYPDEVAEVAKILGKDELRLRDVDVTLLIQPERVAQAERHIEATNAALFFYGLWWGEYPYEHITVVDPAWGGGAAGGMEYPTLFTCGTSLYTFPEMHRPESVTIHEAGHQFWYGLVGNNEFEAAWMDEGLNSFTDSEVLWRHYGHSHATTRYSGIYLDGRRPASLPGGGEIASALTAKAYTLPLAFGLEPVRSSGFLDWWRDQPMLTLVPEWSDPRWGDRSGYLRDPDSDPICTHAFRYVDGSSYGTNSYSRPAAALRSIQGVVGREAFLKGMRHHSEAWRYDHPYPDDFFGAFNEGSGVDLSWYFDEVFKGTGTVDWSVDVSQRKASGKKGMFPDPETGEYVEYKKGGDKDDDDEESDEESSKSKDDERPYLIQIIVKRDGTLRLPLRIRWTFEDDEDAEEGQAADFGEHLWTREEQDGTKWWRLRFESKKKLKSVVLDPDRTYYLDGDMSNNQWYAEKDELAPWRWSERILTQYTHLLHWHSDIGG